MSHDCWVVCPPGLERFAVEQLRDMGVRPGPAGTGGVATHLSTAQLYGANLRLRTATRILVRVARFSASNFEALQHGLEAIEWDRWLSPGRPVSLSVTSHRSRLFHTDAVAERAVAVIGHPVEADAQLFVLRVVDDQVTVSVDSSGAPLHERGWRVGAPHAAPLRATIAAGLLMAAGYDGSMPLVDPFCGSGTIAIEAGLLARRAPVNAERRFACMDWPSYKRSALREARAAADSARVDVSADIRAYDRDDGAVESTVANAAAAGVAMTVERATVSSLDPGPGPGLIATNPPYGHRLGNPEALRDLYDRWGAVLRERCGGWSLALVDGNPTLSGRLGVPLAVWATVQHGGLRVRLAGATIGSAPPRA